VAGHTFRTGIASCHPSRTHAPSDVLRQPTPHPPVAEAGPVRAKTATKKAPKQAKRIIMAAPRCLKCTDQNCRRKIPFPCSGGPLAKRPQLAPESWLGPPLSPGLAPRSAGSDGIDSQQGWKVPKDGPTQGWRAFRAMFTIGQTLPPFPASQYARWVPTTPSGNLKWEYFRWPRRTAARWGHFYSGPITSYSKATPSGSFSSNHFSAAS
jgi:hypothetical protein